MYFIYCFFCGAACTDDDVDDDLDEIFCMRVSSRAFFFAAAVLESVAEGGGCGGAAHGIREEGHIHDQLW